MSEHEFYNGPLKVTVTNGSTKGITIERGDGQIRIIIDDINNVLVSDEHVNPSTTEQPKDDSVLHCKYIPKVSLRLLGYDCDKVIFVPEMSDTEKRFCTRAYNIHIRGESVLPLFPEMKNFLENKNIAPAVDGIWDFFQLYLKRELYLSKDRKKFIYDLMDVIDIEKYLDSDRYNLDPNQDTYRYVNDVTDDELFDDFQYTIYKGYVETLTTYNEFNLFMTALLRDCFKKNVEVSLGLKINDGETLYINEKEMLIAKGYCQR